MEIELAGSRSAARSRTAPSRRMGLTDDGWRYQAGIASFQAQLMMLNWLNSASRGLRSEERRVGKECRSRWAPYRSKKKVSHEAVWHCDRSRRSRCRNSGPESRFFFFKQKTAYEIST